MEKTRQKQFMPRILRIRRQMPRHHKLKKNLKKRALRDTPLPFEYASEAAVSIQSVDILQETQLLARLLLGVFEEFP